MAARLAGPAQGAGGGASPGGSVRELIVIPDIHLQHTLQQVSTAVVDVNGDSSGHSSPTAETQHTYITVAVNGAWSQDSMPLKTEYNQTQYGEWHRGAVDPLHNMKSECYQSDQESEGGTGVNYHVQYVEPQEIYTQSHQTHMETLRTYPVYGVEGPSPPTAEAGTGTEEAGVLATAGGVGGGVGGGAWGGAEGEFAAYGVVVAADEAGAPASPATPAQPPRMPPATVQWLLDHYETAEGVSLPRSTLYAHYLRHCAAHRLDPVNAASFGKLIRSVFVGLRTRRLGTRGNSKYHYYGIRAKVNADSPPGSHDDSLEDKTDILHQEVGETDEEGAVAGTVGPHRQYLGTVTAPEPPALLLAEVAGGIAEGPEQGEVSVGDGEGGTITAEELQALRDHHRQHGIEFLEAVAALDTLAVERARRAFWRRPPAALCRRALLRLASLRPVAAWLRRADLALYQRAVDLLLPDVLRPIPPQLTQSIRNFAKSLEGALSAGSAGAPPPAARAQSRAAAALAAALRRYTSLNHLAQAARAVLHNHHQIQQMLSDLNRVDFRVVREQAAWACACAHPRTAHTLEQDFKATLGRGASLEQWALWLEACVRGALAPHEQRPDYASRARRFLLDWSFYSSLVIRELTLRSAASFGSFHLIRLLYDEYVAYLVERRVAAHRGDPPIAVMHQAQEDEEETIEESKQDVDEEDPEWEWGDEEEEDDESDCKRSKIE